MSGMTDVIADALSKHSNYVRNEDEGGVICDECGWEVASKWQVIRGRTAERMNEHESLAVLEELTKAGFGSIQAALLSAADEMPIESLLGADKASVWLRQRAHSLDPKGRELVQAIHDRKAEG
ncbi:hypothetical protein [Arthrobacter luteolus]|uniref:hypothetical protein n=1 Tax=Arthrobacter luteolus TaxID=98672 RepID=UPI00082FD0D5|nr:hypothetical protein [Arthrobacter luteolus]